MPHGVLPPGSTPSGVTPNMDGFAAAQKRLRQFMGTEVIFRIPVDPSWPVDTPLDPQTNRPYDPTVEPESGGGFTTVTKTIALVFRPIHVNVEDPVGSDVSGGIRGEESIAMAISDDDYPDVEFATRAHVGDIEYKITQVIRDPGPDERFIAFAEAR